MSNARDIADERRPDPAARCRTFGLAVHSSRSRGFTAIELLIFVGIFVILAAIFIPYVLKLREENRRVACRDHLRQLGAALRLYADGNEGYLPRTVHDPQKPLTSFSASGMSGNPFAEGSPVAANDVTASLWLLVRGGFVGDTGLFLCPGSPGGARGAAVSNSALNFSDPSSLTYSYAAPFGATHEYRLTDTLKSGFVLMADASPGSGAAAVGRDAPPLDFAVANTPLHRRAGQNVLYSEGTVLWMPTPFCGMNNDNIYTVRGERGSTQPTSQPATDNGSIDLSILPTAADDSFLIPFSP